MLWNYVVDLDRLDGPGGPRPEGPAPATREKPSHRERFMLDPPALADLDRDGTPDVIATVAFGESREESGTDQREREPGLRASNPVTDDSSWRSRVDRADGSGLTPSTKHSPSHPALHGGHNRRRL